MMSLTSKTFFFNNISRRHLYLTVALVVTSILHLKGISKGDFWFSDDARHAMDGVFILDFFRDLPFAHPVDYLIQYYAKYPALGIGVYPPIFAIVEALFFAFFGISLFSAKLTVLFFALLAVYFWFLLTVDAFNEEIAFYSTLLFITSPFILKWSTAVMLEMPTLAVIIIAAYFYYKQSVCARPKYLTPVLLSTVVAILTKQTACFLIVFFITFILLNKRRKPLLLKKTIVLTSVFFILLLLFVFFTVKFGNMNLKQAFGTANFLEHYSIWWHLFYYLIALGKVLFPYTIISFCYIFYLLITRLALRPKYLFFIAWLLGFYITFSLIQVKTPRYGFFCVPPLALFAILFVQEFFLKIQKNWFTPLLIVPLLCYQIYVAFASRQPTNMGYRQAAEYIMNKPIKTILFHGSGVGTGSFIFHVRSMDDKRERVILRADKILASSALNAQSELVEHVNTLNEVDELIHSLGVEYLVIDKYNHYNIKAYQLLRKLLDSEKFILEKEFKLYSGKQHDKIDFLAIYKKLHPTQSTKKTLRMRLPIVGVNIIVPLDVLFNFYTPSTQSLIHRI